MFDVCFALVKGTNVIQYTIRLIELQTLCLSVLTAATVQHRSSVTVVLPLRGHMRAHYAMHVGTINESHASTLVSLVRLPIERI